MASPLPKHVQTPAEQLPRVIRSLRPIIREPVNGLTHLLGVALSVLGLVLLLGQAGNDPWQRAAAWVYGVSLIVLYSASSLLHSVHANPLWYRRLRIFDHAAIFVLIAGTYTPICLLTLRQASPAWGWGILISVWLLAGLGVFFKLRWMHAPRWLSTALYLLMGWLALVAIGPLWHNLSTGALVFLALGGLWYSWGAVIYARKKPDPYPLVFGYHGLWHCLVLAGSMCHFLMIYYYILY